MSEDFEQDILAFLNKWSGNLREEEDLEIYELIKDLVT